MAEPTRREELADFLRTRRARLTPAQVGLPAGPRRRTPGLRREEVALLAGVGITWYTFLEQGRPIKVSEQTLARVAGALRLAPLEVEHLFTLADRPLPPTSDDEQVPEVVRALIDALGPVPTNVINSRFDILAWNLAAMAVWMDPGSIPVAERNYVWLLFGSPEARDLMADWELHAREMLAALRFNYGQNQDDPRFVSLIERCSEVSPEFRTWWAQHEVVHRTAGPSLLRHPTAGDLHFDVAMFRPDSAPTLQVIFNIPRPGTGTREKILGLMEQAATPQGAASPARGPAA